MEALTWFEAAFQGFCQTRWNYEHGKHLTDSGFRFFSVARHTASPQFTTVWDHFDRKQNKPWRSSAEDCLEKAGMPKRAEAVLVK